jgi:hypothetical protein
MSEAGEVRQRGKARTVGRGRGCRWTLILKREPQCGRETELEVVAGDVWVVTDAMWRLALLLQRRPQCGR